MFNIDSKLSRKGEIVFLEDYHPKRNGNNPFFNDFCINILNLKGGFEVDINYFANRLAKLFDNSAFLLCTVPSSTANPQNNNGVAKLARKLTQIKPNIKDGTNYLIRNKSIPKAHLGGARDIQLHLDTIIVNNLYFAYNIPILILDDVTTTGSSLIACKKLLLKYSKDVTCMALGHTTNEGHYY